MDTLYKYRSYSARALEMLIKRQLYFATPHQLNDPYDCRVSIRQALTDAIEKTGRSGNQTLHGTLERFRKIDHVYEKMETELADIGVVSLSKSPTNVVMWAHYADDHRGFCAGFQLSNKFTTHRNDHQIVGTNEVLYSGGNPFVDFFEEVAARKQPPLWDEFWMSLLSIGMVAKAAAWAYEEEVRVLRKGGGPVSFDPSELSQIVFGMNMTGPDRATLRQLLQRPEWNHIQFREIVRSEGFAVRIVDAAAT